MELKPIQPENFQSRFPEFYQENTQYFMMVKNGTEQGICAIVHKNNDICEIILTVFKDYRYKLLSKDVLINVMDFPFSLGFKTITTFTTWPSWVKLLNKLDKYGLRRMDFYFSPGETWFYKKKEY